MPSRSAWSGAIVLLGCLLGGPALAQAPVLSDAGAKQAATNYERSCSLCHGKDREGHVNGHAPSLRSQSLLESDPAIIGEATHTVASARRWAATSTKSAGY